MPVHSSSLNWEREEQGLPADPVLRPLRYSAMRFAKRATIELFPKLPSAASEDTPPVVSRAKSHPAMLRAMTQLAEGIAREVDTRIRSTMAKWPSGEVVVRAWEQVPKDLAPDQKLTALSAWYAGKRALGKETAAGLPDVTRATLKKMFENLAGA